MKDEFKYQLVKRIKTSLLNLNKIIFNIYENELTIHTVRLNMINIRLNIYKMRLNENNVTG